MGQCTSGVSQTLCLWACGKLREGERLPRARSQELLPLLSGEDMESQSFLLHFSPPGGHFSRFHCDKEGALGRVSISGVAAEPTADPLRP